MGLEPDQRHPVDTDPYPPVFRDLDTEVRIRQITDGADMIDVRQLDLTLLVTFGIPRDPAVRNLIVLLVEALRRRRHLPRCPPLRTALVCGTGGLPPLLPLTKGGAFLSPKLRMLPRAMRMFPSCSAAEVSSEHLREASDLFHPAVTGYPCRLPVIDLQ